MIQTTSKLSDNSPRVTSRPVKEGTFPMTLHGGRYYQNVRIKLNGLKWAPIFAHRASLYLAVRPNAGLRHFTARDQNPLARCSRTHGAKQCHIESRQAHSCECR